MCLVNVYSISLYIPVFNISKDRLLNKQSFFNKINCVYLDILNLGVGIFISY